MVLIDVDDVTVNMFAPGRASRQIARMANRGKHAILQRTLTDDVSADIPRWRWLIGALLLATAVLGYPVAGGAFLVNPQSEQYVAGYAFRDFVTQSLRSGHGFPQWNAFMFGGMPYAAALHGDVFYPTFLLQLVMRTDLAITWGFIIHLFLAGLFTIGFLRAVGLSRWAATFGALAYMLSGPVASLSASGQNGQLFVSALLPLALWMLVRSIRGSRRYAWGVLSLAVGLAALTAEPQMLQQLLLVCVAFSVFLIWSASHDDVAATLSARILPVLASAATNANFHTASSLARANSTHRTRFFMTRLGAVVGVLLLGACIGAVQYWPALGYLKSSTLADGLSYENATRFSLPPEELLNAFLPQFSGMLARYWGRGEMALHSAYLGVVVLMFAPLAFGGDTRKAFARFWLVVAGISLAWALGSYTPFFQIVYAVVPATAYFHAPSLMLGLFTFALCVLSALGLERVLTREIRPRVFSRHLIAWIVLAVVLLVLAMTDVLALVSHAIIREFTPPSSGNAAFSARMIDFNQRSLLLGATRSLALVVGVGVLVPLFQKRWLRSATFAALLLATCALDLWSIARRYWIFSQPAAELFARDPIISHLKKADQPGRVFVFTKTADFRTATDPYFGAGGFGEGGGLMLHGVRSVTGYHPNPLARYKQLVNTGALINPAFWQHENVRWLYANAEITDTALKKVTGTFTNSAGSITALYELPGNYGYAWIASSFGVRSDTAAAKEVLSVNYDARRFVSVAPETVVNGAPVAPAPALFSDASTITTSVTDFGAGRATVHLSAPAQSGNVLIISENYYNGWHATSEGKSLPVVRAAFNLVGVVLPVGARTIAVSFQDSRYATGRFITLSALLVTGLLLLTGWRRHRQTRAQSVGEYKMTGDGAA